LSKDGRILPWFELLLGVLLILGVALRWAGSIIPAAARIHRCDDARKILGLEINCGCFGNKRSWNGHADSRQQLLVSLSPSQLELSRQETPGWRFLLISRSPQVFALE